MMYKINKKGGVYMKSTGVVRKVDELGRIVIPVEIRRIQNIEVKDPLEIYVDGEKIILVKHDIKCVFCSDTEDLIDYIGKKICPKCFEEIRK